MFTYALLGLAALMVVGFLAWQVNRSDRTDETERFQYARELTSRWSAEGSVMEAAPVQKTRRTRKLGLVRRGTDHASAA